MAPEARPPVSPHQAAALLVAALAVGALGHAAVGDAEVEPSHHRDGPDSGAVRVVDAKPDAGPVESRAARALREGRAMDVNRASAADLELLPRIGPALAGRIVESRRDEGPFAGPADLARVRGIGPRTVERLRPFVRAGPAGPDVPGDAGSSAAVAAPEDPDG